MHQGTDAGKGAARQVTADRSHSVRASHLRGSVWGLVLSLVAAGASLAATANYEYDALGRLTRVELSDGKRVVYRLDAAGNRTQVVSGSLPGVPSSINVPSTSTSGSYTVSWGSATGTVTAYQLYEAASSSFSGQSLVYSGTGLNGSLPERGNGTYYYRVRACFDSDCSAYRTGSNGVAVTIATQPIIQVLNPSIQVGASGQITQITTLANLNNHAATIHGFSETCAKASVAIQSGAQTVKWTNSNTFQLGCDVGDNEQCGATYVIRDSSSGQQYPGTASITVIAQGVSPPPGTKCP
jgi:YD repeat-containing protein